MTQPNSDPDIAVVGASGTIKVATSDDLTGPQVCTFERYENPNDAKDSSAGLKKASTWKETVVFKKAGYQVKKEPVWHGAWIVGVEASKSDIPSETCFVRAYVSKAQSAARIPAINEYRIPGFAVTTNQKMKDIMLHEFSKQTRINAGLANWEYDEAPLKKFIRSLTWQQRGLLCNYNEKRLVVFISMRGVRKDHPMLMDNSPKVHANRKQCYANADFSVFRCRKKGHKVSLECHTEYFCVNTNNGDALSRDTPNFLNVSYRHMAPTQRNPWKLHLAAESHHKYCVYISVINAFQAYSVQGTPIDPKTKKRQVGPDGKLVIVTTTIGVGTSIMAGNYIHGGINTKGCWPLFRNFNWPLVKQEQFLSIYLNDVRAGTGATEIAKKLANLRYDAPLIKGSKWSSSFEKFLIWDQNYAYTFFCKYVLGIDFYSRADGLDGPNLFQTHGRCKDAKQFTKEEKSFNKDHRFAPSPGVYDFYENPDEKPISDTFWKNNELDTPTASRWGLPFADCYIYNPDNLSLAKLKESPFDKIPAPIP